MLIIPVEKSPAQLFSFVAENAFYQIRIKASGDFLYADIKRNTTDLVTGWRIVNNQFLIPFNSSVENYGNLFFSGENDYPNPDSLGVNDFLYYLTADEYETLAKQRG